MFENSQLDTKELLRNVNMRKDLKKCMAYWPREMQAREDIQSSYNNKELSTCLRNL